MTHEPPRPAAGKTLLLFDGVCALCNWSVRFLLRIDRRRRLVFAPLEGEAAAAVRERHSVPKTLDSMILVRSFETPDESVSSGSSAVLGSLAIVGGAWRIVSWLRVVPRPLRDLVYRWIARNRYRWFGRYDACPAPSAEMAERFLD